MEYSCNLCGSNLFKIKSSETKSLGLLENKFNVVSCKNCNLYSLNPIPTDNEFKEIYSKYADKGDRVSVEKQRKEKVYPKKFALIKKLYPNAQSVLDIGAGIGGLVSTAKDFGFNAKGIEFENEQVALAKKIFNIELVNIKFENFIKTNEEKFDVIILHHVFEHLQNPSQMLDDVKKIMHEKSILIIEVPNQFFRFPNSIYFKIGLRKYNLPYNPFHHLYFYSKKTLIKYLLDHQYQIIHFEDKIKGSTNLKTKLKIIISNLFNLSTSHVFEIVGKRK